MTAPMSPLPYITIFTAAEKRSLRALRARYQEDADLFSPRERAHLLFLRWLYRTGRLTEMPLCPPVTRQEVPMVTH